MKLFQKFCLHELCFGLFLFLTWLRLTVHVGVLNIHSLLYFFLFTLALFLAAASWGQEQSQCWMRIRLLFYPLVMNLTYMEMRISVPLINDWQADAALQRVDRMLIGENLSLRLETFVNPALTEVMSFCYVLFMPYLFLSLLWYFLGDLKLLRLFYSGIFSVYGLGFIGYSLLPALGPYLAMASQFSVPLSGWFFTSLCSKMVVTGSNHVDVFPSLHCAVSSFMLFFDRRHKPWRYYVYLLPCIGLWISTIYLRYHYFIDLAVGFTLSSLVLRIVHKKAGECTEMLRG